MSQIAEEWRSAFDTVPPVGWACRVDFNCRWLRIHSLPSKRWPDSEDEFREVCRRHNEAATTVLGLDQECILILGIYLDEPSHPEPTSFPGGTRALQPQPELTTKIDDEGVWLGFCAERTTWQPQKFDPLIRTVADDRMANVLFFSPSRGSVYAPYDGGADLILPSAETVPVLSERWCDWISDREDGL